MKRWITLGRKGLFSIGLLMLGHILPAQQTPKAYFFDGDEVVFEFDSRLYTRTVQEGRDRKMDFADLDIREVILSGNFNDWSKEGWTMKKVGRYRYQLRKRIEELDGEFTWEFKFLINGEYWVEPHPEQRDGKMWSDEFLEGVYQLKVYDIEPTESGNALFVLSGYEQAGEVVLTGSFNGWNEHHLKMHRTEGGWQLRLDLAPGRYEYKFIADGVWLHDPANPNKVRNEYNTFNSVLMITKRVAFILEGFPAAERVILAGSFNGWNEKNTRLSWQDGVWSISLDLPGGKHYYKFIVDGQWMVDPRNPLREKDRRGNENSVLMVQ